MSAPLPPSWYCGSWPFHFWRYCCWIKTGERDCATRALYSASADQPGDPLGISQYDFFRSRAFRVASRIGTYPVMTAAEIRLLAAEGYLRQGQVALAAGLIDSSR